MSEQTPEQTPEPTTGPLDAPPKDGVWRDWDGAQLDPATIAEGNRLGESIDAGDDEDNGL
jgi:hypothetical protein